MESTTDGVAVPRRWSVALLGGAVASVVYTAVLAASVAFSTVTVGGPIWRAAVEWTVLNLGSVGVPVALWLRYRLLAPVACLGLVLLFWHVLVEVPPLGSGRGDSPGFTFVLAFAPLYVVVYALLAVGESRIG